MPPGWLALLILIPTGGGETLLDWIRFPAVEGLKLAGIHPQGWAWLAVPALAALVYAMLAFLVFGEKRVARS